MTTGKTIALTRQTFVGKVMSLLFNMLVGHNFPSKEQASFHFMGNRSGNSGNKCQTLFWGAPKSLQMVTAAMKLKDAYSLEEKL